MSSRPPARRPARTSRSRWAPTTTGRLDAAEAYLAYEAGAIPGSPVGAGAMCIFACYDIPNVHIDGYDVVVNKPATSAYRAPGATNAAFAAETVVDEICEKLKIDPLDFRIKNGAHEGHPPRRRPASIPRIGMVETVEAAKKHPHYTAPLGRAARQARQRRARPQPHARPRRGVGLLVQHRPEVDAPPPASTPTAPSAWSKARPTSAARAPRIAMQLAEALGIRAEDVRPVGRRHRQRRLHRRDRRQPRHLRHRLGRLRGRPGHQAADDRPRRPHLGGRSRTT